MTALAGLDAFFSTPHCALMEDQDSYNDVEINLLSAVPNVSSICGLRPTFKKKITNETYLKRMYINQQFTKCFIPSVDAILSDESIKQYNQRVSLMNVAGRTWDVEFEVVKSHKQLHCRLKKGWSLFCHDNGVSLHDCLVFQQMTCDNQCTLLVSVCKEK